MWIVIKNTMINFNQVQCVKIEKEAIEVLFQSALSDYARKITLRQTNYTDKEWDCIIRFFKQALPVKLAGEVVI